MNLSKTAIHFGDGKIYLPHTLVLPPTTTNQGENFITNYFKSVRAALDASFKNETDTIQIGEKIIFQKVTEKIKTNHGDLYTLVDPSKEILSEQQLKKIDAFKDTGDFADLLMQLASLQACKRFLMHIQKFRKQPLIL